MFVIGEWYSPDLASVPERSAEERERDERYIAHLAEKGIDIDPWPERKHARAAETLLREVLAQFGPGVMVDLRHEIDNLPQVTRALREISMVDGLPCAEFDGDPDGDPADPEAGEELIVAFPCEFISAVRVVGAAGEHPR